MKHIVTLVRRVIRYFSALIRVGGAFSLLGLLPEAIDLFSAYLRPWLKYDLPVPDWLTVVLVLIFFGVANLRLYEKYAHPEQRIKVERVRNESVGLGGEWLTWGAQGLALNSTAVLKAWMRANIVNLEHTPTWVEVTIVSLACEWPFAGEVSDLKVNVQTHADNINARKENPFHLNADEMMEIIVSVDIPFPLPSGEEAFDFLGTLHELSITLSFNQGEHVIPVTMIPDIEGVQQTVLDRLMDATRYSNGALNKQISHALSSYWQAYAKPALQRKRGRA